MSTDPNLLDSMSPSETPSPLGILADDGLPATPETTLGDDHDWRSRYTGFLHLPLSRVQAVIGITAGMLSITGMMFPALRAMYPLVGRGHVIAVVREARSDAPVPDATVEILTPENAVVTTLVPGAAGRVRYTVTEGAYRVQVTHPRFGVERRHIHVMAGQVAEIRFRLLPRPPQAGTVSAMPLLDAPPADRAAAGVAPRRSPARSRKIGGESP